MYKISGPGKLNKEAGATLVEAVVAVAIITTALTALIIAMSSAKPIARASVNKEKAKFYAQEKAGALLSGIRDESAIQGAGLSTQPNGIPLRAANSEVSVLCSSAPSFCETIIVKNKSTATEAEVVSFIGINESVPADYEVAGRRIWALAEEDAARGVWRATVAVFPPVGSVPVEEVIVRTIK